MPGLLERRVFIEGRTTINSVSCFCVPGIVYPCSKWAYDPSIVAQAVRNLLGSAELYISVKMYKIVVFYNDLEMYDTSSSVFVND